MASEIVLSHQPCPHCGSHDALSVYDDGHTYCFSCNTDTQASDNTNDSNTGVIPFENQHFAPIKSRGITESTCRRYDYTVGRYKGQPVHIANYKDKQGNIIGQKIRGKDKVFKTLGKISKTFYGQHLFNNGEKLYITEGEIDCLTLSQLLGNIQAVVSIPSGAQSARKTFENNIDWLKTFKEIVVVFDNDTAGRKAVESIKGVLPPNVLKVANLSLHKDVNEYYVANHGKELLETLENARSVRLDNVINGSELWKMLEEEPTEIYGYSLPWQDLPANEMLKGIRKGEITMITAGTGTGKSTLIREIMYDLVMRHNKRVGIMMLEENITRTAKGIIGIHLERPIHISRKNLTNDEYKKAYDQTLGNGRFILYNHFGSLDNNSILDTIRYMVFAEKIDFIILDHISIAVSGIESKDERKTIDVLMTRLRQLCEELKIGIVAVCHLKRTDKQSAEEGGRISLDDLRGSQAIAQLSDTIIALERNQQATDKFDKNTVKVRILKCRHTGETGLGGKLYFSKERNRLIHDTTIDEDEEPTTGEYKGKTIEF